MGRELVQALGCQSASLSGMEGSFQCDATDAMSLAALFDHTKPEVVVNCVGLADVDKAEKDVELAERLNAGVVRNLATEQARRRFRLVHISTDYVFDGRRGNYLEGDPTNPVNAYGRTKLEGERVATTVPDALILRISSPFGIGFGARKVQFFRYVVDSLRAGRTVRALTDQRITPTYLPDLAAAVDRLTTQSESGIFHVGGTQPVTRLEFATEIARAAGLDERLIEPTTSGAMTTWVARRPLDTSLNVDRSRQAGVRYTPIPAALRALLDRVERPGPLP